MGATFGAGSDAYPATVQSVSKSGKAVTITADECLALSEWKEGAYAPENWTSLPQPEGRPETYTLRKNGRWILQGQPITAYWCQLYLGRRDWRRDPHF
jgi:hypothetical protein